MWFGSEPHEWTWLEQSHWARCVRFSKATIYILVSVSQANPTETGSFLVQPISYRWFEGAAG